MMTLPSSKLKFEEAYPNDWDVFNACVTSVEVPGSISADAPSSFRAFMRTAPSAAWDEAQTR